MIQIDENILACNQWVDLDAHVSLIDQEPNDQGYFDSQTMSLSLYDGSFYSGALDGNIVTFPDAGDWTDWVGVITKPKIEDCFQNKLDEYCRNLGIKDDHPVEGEEGFKFPVHFRSVSGLIINL